MRMFPKNQLALALLAAAPLSIYAADYAAEPMPMQEPGMMLPMGRGRGEMMRRDKVVMKATSRLRMLEKSGVPSELKGAVSTFRDAIEAQKTAAKAFLQQTDDNPEVKRLEDEDKQKRTEMREKMKNQKGPRGREPEGKRGGKGEGKEKGRKKGWFSWFGGDEEDAETDSE